MAFAIGCVLAVVVITYIGLRLYVHYHKAHEQTGKKDNPFERP